jgi:energy-converting hydrogenase A subunit O
MLQDVATVADAVATYASVDPCVACTERVIILNEKGEKTEFDGLHKVKYLQ